MGHLLSLLHFAFKYTVSSGRLIVVKGLKRTNQIVGLEEVNIRLACRYSHFRFI
jgi:hypothetical protein